MSDFLLDSRYYLLFLSHQEMSVSVNIVSFYAVKKFFECLSEVLSKVHFLKQAITISQICCISCQLKCTLSVKHNNFINLFEFGSFIIFN